MKETNIHDIQNILLDIGIPTNLLGFLYLAYAIELSLYDYEYVVRATKMLYVDVAQKYHTEPHSVERAIRHTIIKAFTSGGNTRVIQLFINETYNKAPSPTQFLSRMYFYMINDEHEKRLSS